MNQGKRWCGRRRLFFLRLRGGEKELDWRIKTMCERHRSNIAGVLTSFGGGFEGGFYAEGGGVVSVGFGLETDPVGTVEDVDAFEGF